MTTGRPVLLVDFSALFRRAWHVSSDVSHAFEATVAGVNRAAGSLPDCLVAICCDGRGNWRKEISAEYKANRERQPAELYGEMERTLDRLRRDGRLIWKFDGFEADDVIATAVMMAKSRGHWCRIVSHDKDLLQLLGPACDFLAIHKSPWEVATSDVVRDRYGVEPEQFRDWLALTGDSSDNVKGCPGIGAKTATALIHKYHSIEGIYHAMTALCEVCKGQGTAVACTHCKAGKAFDPVSTPANVRALEQHRNSVLESRRLVSLSQDVPIKFDEIYEVRDVADLDERDHMNEAEKDADKYFGNSETTDKTPDGATTEVAESGPYPPQSETGRELVSPKPEPTAAPLKEDPKKDVAPDVSASEESTALTSVRSGQTADIVEVQVEYSRQLEPRSFRDAMVFASVMHHSRVYSRYPTQGSIAAAVVRGREMGYGAAASLDIFHVADFRNDGNLRLMIHAHVVIDRAMRDPSLEYFKLVSSDAEHATYEAKVKRNAEPTIITYTIEDARLAGLVKPGSNWEKRPTEQCRKTAGVLTARVVAPWSAMGLYCPEEMGVDA